MEHVVEHAGMYFTVAAAIVAIILLTKRFFPTVKFSGIIPGNMLGAISATQRGYISAAFPVIAMWGIALYTLKTLFPGTWNAWSDNGLWIATALVMIYALSRTWTTKADRFAVILFTIAAVMVIVHETSVLPAAAKEMRLGLSWMGFGSQNGPRTTEYSIAPGEGPVSVTMPFGKSTTLHCTGDLRFMASWTDDGGHKERTGTCRDLNTGRAFSGVEGVPMQVSMTVSGGVGGGMITATTRD